MDQLLEKIFIKARTHNSWQEKSIDDDLLKQIYDLAKLGPTSANCQPLRVLFIKSPEAKDKLKKCLYEANIHKAMTAPVTAIFAYDENFYEHLPKLFPHTDAKSMFVNNSTLIEHTAKLNTALQAAYFIIAARSLGLDCGPMAGFNNNICEQEFFQGTTFKPLFLCNLGYGDPSSLFPRLPRHEFTDVCKIL
jgi:3-hydroxypropanoate dehydrogenase